MNKNLSIGNFQNKYPTTSQFEKMVSKFNPKVTPRKSLSLLRPTVPKYLRDMECSENPFTSIKISSTSDLKLRDRECKEFHKMKTCSITENVSRATRIKFNANFKLKTLKFDLDNEEIDNKINPVTKSLSKVQFTPIDDFLLTNRQICLLNLAIKVKEEDIKNLDKIVDNEEKSIKRLNEVYENKKERHLEILKSVCQKTYEAVNLADRETRKKKKILLKVKRENYALSKINSDCIRLEEEYLKLKSYKIFLYKCKEIQNKKQNLERPSLIKELLSTTMAIENKLNRVFRSEMGGSSEEATVSDNKIRSMLEEIELADESTMNDNNIQPLLQSNNINFDRSINSDKLKVNIFSDLNNSNNKKEENSNIAGIMDSYASIRKDDLAIDEHDQNDTLCESVSRGRLPFNDPQDLINILTNLEINNLSLIENVQEQDIVCEHMKQKIFKVKNEMDTEITQIENRMASEKKKIRAIKESIKWIESQANNIRNFNTLDRYNEIFFFKDLNIVTMDELISYIHKEVQSLYFSISENSEKEDTKLDLLEMLKTIETVVDSLYIEIQQYDIRLIRKAKKVIDLKKRKDFHLLQKQLDTEKRAKKLQMVMDHFQMAPKYRFGKKIVYRSNPPKRVLEITKVNEDDVKEQEEMAYFFT